MNSVPDINEILKLEALNHKLCIEAEKITNFFSFVSLD